MTVGEILVEIMATERGFGFGEPIDLRGPFPSGAPAIFIDQVGRLGGAAGIVGSVGDDDFGAMTLKRLRADGVDVSAVSISRDRPTGTAFVRYRADGDRDFVFNIALSAAGEMSNSDAARSLMARAGHLHVMGSALAGAASRPVIETALQAVGERGGTVSFDPNIRKELMSDPDLAPRLMRLLGATDLFLPSGDELRLFADGTNEDEMAASIIARGVAEIVLKRGAHGATVFTRAGRAEVSGLSVDEVDPTGAGDIFGATYVTCRRMAMPIEAALRYANAAGALAVTRLGPMEGASGFAMLDAFLQEQARKGAT